ncbi:MAG TPA: hypothetical protein VFQ61_20940, partial [Polyangiaceae bacterium]|nr:hypothetical protein [Polyangiaceae bacterium]
MSTRKEPTIAARHARAGTLLAWAVACGPGCDDFPARTRRLNADVTPTAPTQFWVVPGTALTRASTGGLGANSSEPTRLSQPTLVEWVSAGAVRPVGASDGASLLHLPEEAWSTTRKLGLALYVQRPATLFFGAPNGPEFGRAAPGALLRVAVKKNGDLPVSEDRVRVGLAAYEDPAATAFIDRDALGTNFVPLHEANGVFDAPRGWLGVRYRGLRASVLDLASERWREAFEAS